MRKKLLLSLALIGGAIICQQNYVSSYAAGPPAGYTGAIGDNGSCAVSGCHSGTANSGPGSITVTLLDGTTEVATYQPGKKYTVQVTVEDPDASKTGFQATVKGAGTNTSVGQLTTGGNSNVQLNSTTYINHTLSGTVNTPGNWQFEWTAPNEETGTVTIYAAGNAANGDGMSTSDRIYTTSKNFAEEGSSSITDNELFASNVSLFPNPASDMLQVSFVMPEAGMTNINIYSLDGKHVRTVAAKQYGAGAQTVYADVLNLEKGAYFVRISAAGHVTSQKVLKL